jgi:hypothetical protein
MLLVKEWQDTYRSGMWIKDLKTNKLREEKKMGTAFEMPEMTEMNVNFHRQVYELALKSAHARLSKLYLSIGSKEEKENWKDQVVLMSDLIAKNMEMMELIAKRRLG